MVLMYMVYDEYLVSGRIESTLYLSLSLSLSLCTEYTHVRIAIRNV